MQQRNVHVELNTGQAAKSARPPLSPQEIAQRRAAQTGHKIADCAAGVAICLGVLAFLYIAMFLWGLADTWGDAVRMVFVSGAIAIAMTILPPLRTLTERTYPEQAQMMHAAWLALVAIAFIGVLSYGLTASPQYDARWQPKTYLPHTQIIAAANINQNVARRLIMLIVSLSAVTGAGLMLRWSMIASAESYRLAYGEVGPAPKAQVAPQMEGAAMASSGDVFSAWADNRLWPKTGGRIQGEVAYQDYADTCLLNGVEPMSAKKFGDMLTQRASNSHGRFTKAKLGGKIFYQGWELPDGGKALEYADFQQIEGPKQ